MIQSARWIRARVCLICDFYYFSFISCVLSICTHVVLFDHCSVHKVVTMWWHDSTELGALLVTIFVQVVIMDVPGVHTVALLRL